MTLSYAEGLRIDVVLFERANSPHEGLTLHQVAR